MDYISEAGMEMEVSQALKHTDINDVNRLFDLMKRRFWANHLQFNHSRLYEICERQLKWFE